MFQPMRRTVSTVALSMAVAGMAPAAVASAGTSPSTSTVAALWHMNEPKGATTMIDSSGNGNNGTLLSGVQAGVPGFKGTAYSFSGQSYVDVPNSPTLN